jgi:hypothetical protein
VNNLQVRFYVKFFLEGYFPLSEKINCLHQYILRLGVYLTDFTEKSLNACGPLGYDTVYCGRKVPTFQRNVMFPSYLKLKIPGNFA